MFMRFMQPAVKGKIFSAFSGRAEETGSISDRFPRSSRRALIVSLVAVTLIAIAVRAPLLGSAFQASDTLQYLSVAKGVFHGGYANNLRPPGYATVLAIFELFGANPVKAAVWLQNLIGIVLPACVLLVGWRFFSPAVGIIGGFLAAASPLMIAIEQFALSDYLYCVLLFAGAVLLSEAVLRLHGKTDALKLLIAAGAIFGLATLFRANGLVALLAIPAALLIGAPRWRPALKAAAIAMAAMIVVLAPWTIHNWIRFGDPSIASESGISLYARAVSYDEVPPNSNSQDGRLALSIYNTTAYAGIPEGVVGTTPAVFRALVEGGKSSTEASSAMAGLARKAIAEHPDIYFERSLEILGRYQGLFNPHTVAADSRKDQIATTRTYFRAQDPHAKNVPGGSWLTRIPWQVAQTATMILYVLTIGGLLMLALPFVGDLRCRLAATTMLVVGGFAIIGVTLTARWEARHGIALAPLIWILAPATVFVLVRAIVEAVRGRAWRRTQDATS